ncbi:MAG: hypothetical protein KGJ54_07325 [Betaproteobacteria bacterium]|nr:hypothetical protein [Betaproteobacteria bacterium]
MNSIDFSATDGKTYSIAIDDFGIEIHISFNGVNVGKISLRFIEGAASDGSDNVYHITSLALDKCRQKGIGRRCLQLHRELFGTILTAGNDNGTTSDDGSHLTGDGPGFIAKMRSEGIVSYSPFEGDPTDWEWQ